MKKIIFVFFLLPFILYANDLKNDIDISNMPLSSVLSILSRESGKNIIASQEAKNIIIDAFFEEGDDIDKVLKSLSEAYNLVLSVNNNTTILSLKKESIANKGKLIVKVFDATTKIPLENAKLNLKDTSFFEKISDKNGIIIFDNLPRSTYIAEISKNGFVSKGEIIDLNHSIISLNFPLSSLKNNLKNYSDSIFLDDFNFYEDNGKLIYTQDFSLLNINSDELKKILLENFKDKIKVSSISKTNKILVSAERDILENVRSIVDDLDKNPRQAKITAEILDISNNLFEELGFDWVYNESSSPSEKQNSFKTSLLNSGTNIAYGTIFGNQIALLRQFHNKSDVLNVTLNLLEANNDLTISSIPTITIASGEEGEFKITEEVVVGEKKSRNNKNDFDKKERENNYIAEPIFKEAGLILKVKPLIRDNDEVILDVSIELSNFKFKKNLLNIGEINSGTYNSDGGSKVGRTLSTRVKVKNGDTILLGGLKKSIKQNLESKVPILGDIPILNFFFKRISKKDENSDMYIKIKVDIQN